MKLSEPIRMTSGWMFLLYKGQWLGLQNPIYLKDDDINFLSAEIVYVGETEQELLHRQLIDKEPIFPYRAGDETDVSFTDVMQVDWKPILEAFPNVEVVPALNKV